MLIVGPRRNRQYTLADFSAVFTAAPVLYSSRSNPHSRYVTTVYLSKSKNPGPRRRHNFISYLLSITYDPIPTEQGQIRQTRDYSLIWLHTILIHKSFLSSGIFRKIRKFFTRPHLRKFIPCNGLQTRFLSYRDQRGHREKNVGR